MTLHSPSIRPCLAAALAFVASASAALAEPSADTRPAAEPSIIANQNAPQRLPLTRPSTPAPETRPPAGSADTRNPSPRFGLLGNLGGLRDALWAHGVLLNLDYGYQAATNLEGGDRGPLLRGSGQFTARGLFDFQRMLGLEGASGAIAFTHREGRDVTVDAHLGTQTSVEEIYGRSRIWRLTQFWYDQKFGPWVDLKIGRMPVGEDFAGFACEFQLNALCGSEPGKIAGSYWFNFPVSQWATRLRLGTPETAYLQVGAYQVNPDNLVDGVSFDFGQGTGALVVSEAGWFPKLGPIGLAGSYKVGGWYETSGGNDVLLNGNRLPRAQFGGPPLHRDDRHGFYFVGVQEVYRPNPADKTRNIAVFARAVSADEATSTYSAQVTAGLVYKGFCDERPADWIGFGAGQTLPNPRAVDNVLIGNVLNNGTKTAPTRERFVEAFYSIAASQDIIIRPNIQYIVRQGAAHLKPDVLVLGVKSLINF